MAFVIRGFTAVAKYIASIFKAHKSTAKKIAIDTAADQAVKELKRQGNQSNMGGWFSKTEVVQTGNASVDYHPETLGWTLGAISFMFLTIGCVYFFLKYKKVRQRNLIASIHQEHDRARQHELATIRQTIGNDQKLLAASAAPPRLMSHKAGYGHHRPEAPPLYEH